MNKKNLNYIIQTTQSILNISNKQEKNMVEKITTTCNLKKIINNTVLGIELNFQCDDAIDKFKKKYDVKNIC